MSSPESYQPTPDEIKKAEEMMTADQKIQSLQREILHDIRETETFSTSEENETAERIASLGSQLHEEWRKPRYREDSKDYEPRIKKTKDEAWSQAHGGAVEIDIANTPYEGLPSEWQGENKISAEVAVTEVEKAIKIGTPLDESFVEVASSALHDKWLERNESWAPPEQNKPYTELSEEEKEKDRIIIRKAVEVCSKKEEFNPTEFFNKETERKIDPEKLIDDPEFAETMAYSVKSLRERSRELIDIAESIKEDVTLSERKAYEAVELELLAKAYENRMAVYIKRIEEKEAQGLDASEEKRELKFSLADAYLGGMTSIVGSKYRGLLDKLGIDSNRKVIAKATPFNLP